MFLSLYKEFDIISVIGTQKKHADVQWMLCNKNKITQSPFQLLPPKIFESWWFVFWKQQLSPIHDHKHIPMADSEFLDRGDN